MGMRKFYRAAFAKNRPWNEIVYDIVSAEGHFEENGAVNYMLAQMTARDMGVQATAKTTRLFLGLQVQCTQCHNHPFNKRVVFAVAKNRPWNEIVYDIVSAEGHFEENGAVNYMLAQMTARDMGVQATAMSVAESGSVVS